MVSLNFSWKYIVCAFGIFAAFSFNIRFVFQASSLLNFEAEKCPFCFDETLCKFLDDIRINVNILDYIVGMLNQKFVFFGSVKNKSAVIKRLARKREKDNLDQDVGNMLNNLVDSSELQPNKLNVDFYTKSLLLLNQSFTEPSYKLRICPTLENVDNLLDPIVHERTAHHIYMNIWTSLVLNPEPLLLRIFRYEDGWPVPKYFGSCGRIALVEYCGKTLDNYISHPWLFRVHVVQQLLEMAHNFTYISSDFGVYFRDISYSNVVLDGNMKTRIVDLEHVIIVDKNASRKDLSETWFSAHTSEDYYCDDCIAYSPMKICSHRISDHNFYAVCKEFLYSIYPKDLGFLHSAYDEKYDISVLEKLRFYVEECIHPSTTNTRFEIAKNFSTFLSELKDVGDFEKYDFAKLI